MSEEEIAIRISQILNGLCPSFVRNSNGAIEWHKCKCKIDDSSCVCVWHITDTCVAGTWTKLSFINSYKDKKEANRNSELVKVREVINGSNSKEEGVGNRFELLDL